MIKDQAAQAPSTTTPVASDALRLSCSDAGPAADVIPVDPTPSPPACEGPRPPGRPATARTSEAPAHRNG
ncbi:hypothetical protein GCM10010306_023180 [Streptomyces umbrinus]|nr:hypothetical protein GCM10010306_023180 [Streptomyces umbrinus]